MHCYYYISQIVPHLESHLLESLQLVPKRLALLLLSKE